MLDTPKEAWKCDSIMMKHLPLANNGSDVITEKIKISVCPLDEGNNISPEHAEENIKVCVRYSSRRDQQQPASAGKPAIT